MCGISGVVSLDGSTVNRDEIGMLTNCLSHRGPDDERIEFFWGETAAFGFNRLSIIDLTENSMQPMHSLNGRWALIYNGELYNYLEIRDALVSEGYQFNTSGDTEVVLNALDAWGLEALYKFNGMFSFVLVDKLNRVLHCVRDRFGVKPLFYLILNNSIYFASEIKGFRGISGFDPQIDERWVNWGHINPESSSITILRGVKRLQPGHLLKVDLENTCVQLEKWWTHSRGSQLFTDYYENPIRGLEILLEDAVRIRLRSDVPCAVSLSSGIDSTLIAYYASKVTDGNVVAFCQGNSGSPENDETSMARITAKKLGIKLVETTLDLPLDAKLLIESAIALEGSPAFLPGIYHHYRIMKELGYKVVLEGHGGDELFAGYANHYQDLARNHLMHFQLHEWKAMRLKSLRIQFGQESIGLPQLSQVFRQDIGQEYQQLRGKLKKTLLPFFPFTLGELNEDQTALDSELESRAKDFRIQTRKMSYANKLLFGAFYSGTLTPILENFDRLSMGNSIEVRSPFLDWRFVINAFRIEGKLKFDSDMNKPLLRNLLPQSTLSHIKNQRQKRGFTGHSSWLDSPNVLELIQDIVHSSIFLDSHAWNGAVLSREISAAVKTRNFETLIRNWGKIQMSIFMDDLTA